MSAAETPILAVEESLTHSGSIASLAKALAAAQLQFKSVVKSHKNPHYGSMYADLADLIEATKEALSRNGIALIQSPRLTGQKVGVTTLIVHESGEWLRDELQMPAAQRERFDAQSVGSGITYARRYAYQSLLNIAGEDDDDGNAAAGKGERANGKAAANGDLETLQPSASPNRGHGNEGLERPKIAAFNPDQGIDSITGRIAKLEIKSSKKGSKYLQVTMGDEKLYCFASHVQNALTGKTGSLAMLTFETDEKDGKKFRQVVDVISLDGKPYRDGRPASEAEAFEREFGLSESDLPGQAVNFR